MEQIINKLTVGILAHVDAGKTTLSEALLYQSGALRKMGRVDHRDAFLDTDAQEREKGITIFSKTARFKAGDMELCLLDTPGHIDFSAETERTLGVLDCAILVISGTDGVQGHTRTLFKLLNKHKIPTFVFINKSDLATFDKVRAFESLKKLGDGFFEYSQSSLEDENIALCDEEALSELLDGGCMKKDTLKRLIAQCKIYPCFFGSALKLQGTDEFISSLVSLAPRREKKDRFGARVFKITRDLKGNRLTWLKITGGSLRAKETLDLKIKGEVKQEKINELRLYSGEKYEVCDSAAAGEIAAVTGLVSTYSGQGLGFEKDARDATLEPVLNYRLILPEGVSAITVLPVLRQLEEEDPLLRVIYLESLGELHVRLMGQVQTEVLKRRLKDSFNIDADFSSGNIVYKETVANKVEGIGHFEPLRHYAEVHLILEPAPRGSGIILKSACSVDRLELNWQRLIFTHLLEREHVGVLTGSALTDVQITLASGRAHNKHTEGGDFRQATYRAVRQGLMQAQNVLLEPYYDFTIELPQNTLGRALTDIQNMGGKCSAPEIGGETALLCGTAPVKGMQNYHSELAAYTRGLGSLSLSFKGYDICQNPQPVIGEIGYCSLSDTQNPASSVFCDHGAGFTVAWDEVHKYMHLEPALKPERQTQSAVPNTVSKQSESRGSFDSDEELREIFERTYGKQEREAFTPPPKPARYDLSEKYDRVSVPEKSSRPEYLLVDGYNIIFAWDELKKVAQADIAAARDSLEDILMNYQGFKKSTVILVFDAYKVKGNPGQVLKRNNIYVVYTKEAETADTFIERATYKLSGGGRVRVATSDSLEQMIIVGHGALRLSAESFRLEVLSARVQISDLIARHNQAVPKITVKDTLKGEKI